MPVSEYSQFAVGDR